jgi:hypothetical protein
VYKSGSEAVAPAESKVQRYVRALLVLSVQQHVAADDPPPEPPPDPPPLPPPPPAPLLFVAVQDAPVLSRMLGSVQSGTVLHMLYVSVTQSKPLVEFVQISPEGAQQHISGCE